MSMFKIYKCQAFRRQTFTGLDVFRKKLYSRHLKLDRLVGDGQQTGSEASSTSARSHPLNQFDASADKKR